MKFFSIEMAAVVLAMVIISIFVVFWVRKQDHLERDAKQFMPPPGQAASDEDVVRLAKAGHKIAAIKMYREIHRVGLKDAKEAVEDLGAGFVQSRETPSSRPPISDEEVIRLAKAGNKIEAIKRYREIHGVGLAEAKSAVEDLMDRGDGG